MKATVSKDNWREFWQTDFSTISKIRLKIKSELFLTDDRGISLIEKIEETHREIYHNGSNGLETDLVKIWERK